MSPRLPTFPAAWSLSDPGGRPYFVFWTSPFDDTLTSILRMESAQRGRTSRKPLMYYEHPVVVPQVMHVACRFQHISDFTICVIRCDQGRRAKWHERHRGQQNADKSRTRRKPRQIPRREKDGAPSLPDGQERLSPGFAEFRDAHAKPFVELPCSVGRPSRECRRAPLPVCRKTLRTGQRLLRDVASRIESVAARRTRASP